MSLKALEKKYPNPAKRPGHLTWNLTATSISLVWQGEDFPVLDWLLKQSFQLDESGLIKFTALESCSFKLIYKIHIHKAINDTFLRLNKFYKKRKITSQSFKINNIQVSLKYKQLNSYVHQTFAEKLCDKAGNLSTDYIQIVSWLYPGATVRHARLDKVNKIEEKVEDALALLFLPLVCQYYILQSDSVEIYDVHSTVNSDAIRWSLRYYWQQKRYPVNRIWNVDEFINTWTNRNFDPERFIDDDVLGYLRPEAARAEVTEEVNEEGSDTEDNEEPQARHRQRLGALGVNRAFSLTPFGGGVTFNAKSGRNKDSTSLHFIEFHNTRYQYVFGLDCNHLKDKSRIFAVLDGLMLIRKVGGHDNVFCYDFSPESMVFRWTEDNSPEIFYCFERLATRPGVYAEPTISNDLIALVTTGDINPDELWIGGKIAKNFELENAHIHPGKKKLIAELKQVIARDLDLEIPASETTSNP